MRIIWEDPNYDGPMPLEAFAPLEDFDPIEPEEAEVAEATEDAEETQYQPPAGTGFGR